MNGWKPAKAITRRHFLTDWREIPLAALERKNARSNSPRRRELPDIYREVFTLRDVEEFNVEETARLSAFRQTL